MMSSELKKPEWAGQELRLDPFHLPQVVTYAAEDCDADVTFTISERGAVIRQVLPSSGLPMSIALPINAFVGVAARAVEDEFGEITVTLELMHEDPQLSVPLLVAHDLTDVAADWRAWAATFNLPMMLVEEDGIARPLYESTGPVRTSEPQARRQGQEPRRRRPRFLARRKTGSLGVRMVIEGREIIARN